IWSLASWVVMSFMSIFTILPGEDVWKFIDSTGFHPLLVTLMFFTLTVAFTFFAIAKGVFSQVVLFFSTLKNNAENKIITTDKIYLSKPKVWIISFSMLIVSIIIFIIMFFIQYEPTGVLIDELIEDVREQPNIVYTYTVTESRMHSFDLKLLAKGFITVFNVYNNDGNLIFNWSAEELTSTFGLGLKEGEITLSFIFLTDYDSLVKHFEESGHSELINDDEWQRYRDVLLTGSDSYTASLFLRIR
ncbi:MAG: hypothetical protein LBC71_03815, partial [Oscillospiraceae bacterium]|nr:hypothetical protein [Oscillospiraceae bacterium]